MASILSAGINNPPLDSGKAKYSVMKGAAYTKRERDESRCKEVYYTIPKGQENISKRVIQR